MRDEFVNLQTYTQTTTMPYADLVTLLQTDRHLTARECLEYGFVDEIL